MQLKCEIAEPLLRDLFFVPPAEPHEVRQAVADFTDVSEYINIFQSDHGYA